MKQAACPDSDELEIKCVGAHSCPPSSAGCYMGCRNHKYELTKVKKMKKIKKLTYAEMTKVSTRLSREEMRQIMAGSGPGGGGGDCGNIYCDVGGTQVWMGSGCGPNDPLQQAIENCIIEATADGTYCGGCAQFP